MNFYVGGYNCLFVALTKTKSALFVFWSHLTMQTLKTIQIRIRILLLKVCITSRHLTSWTDTVTLTVTWTLYFSRKSTKTNKNSNCLTRTNWRWCGNLYQALNALKSETFLSLKTNKNMMYDVAVQLVLDYQKNNKLSGRRGQIRQRLLFLSSLSFFIYLFIYRKNRIFFLKKHFQDHWGKMHWTTYIAQSDWIKICYSKNQKWTPPLPASLQTHTWIIHQKIKQKFNQTIKQKITIKPCLPLLHLYT